MWLLASTWEAARFPPSAANNPKLLWTTSANSFSIQGPFKETKTDLTSDAAAHAKINNHTASPRLASPAPGGGIGVTHKQTHKLADVCFMQSLASKRVLTTYTGFRNQCLRRRWISVCCVGGFSFDTTVEDGRGWGWAFQTGWHGGDFWSGNNFRIYHVTTTAAVHLCTGSCWQ